MSQSISPPLKPPGRPYPQQQFSPTNTAASPPPNQYGGYGPPPAKRQRMSPDPRSPPAGSPNGYFGGAPQTQSSYGNPYAPSPVQQTPYSPFATSPQPQSQPPTPGGFNTPQSYNPYQNQNPWQSSSQPPTPSAGPRSSQASPPPGSHPMQHQTSTQMMPPPPRPNKEEKDEKVSVDDLGDSLFGSGINLKEEENYLSSVYNNRHASQPGESFASTQHTSFGSSTISPNNSFSLLTQGTSFGSQRQGPNGALTGTLGQSMSEEDVEKEMERKRQQAARAKAERQQFHLNNQFLLGNVIRNRLDAKAREQGVRLDVQGLFVKQLPTTTTRAVVNGDGSQGLAASRQDGQADSVVDQGAPFGDLVALISLGTGERLRGLLDEALALSRARRYGDHGRVPPEFADIAQGEGEKRDEEVVPENITGTQWEQNQGATESGEAPKAQQTISFQGTLNLALDEINDRDRKAEDERRKKREAIKKKKAAAEPNATGAGDGDTDTANATSAEATPAAEPVAPTTKISKKEAAKQAKEASKAAEQMSHASTNSTAMAAALGGKRSRYAWMAGAGGATANRYKPTSGASTPRGEAGPGGPGPGAGGKSNANGVSDPSKEVRGPKWGDWRESGSAGKGVQLRDWVAVLERDGREKKALQKAYMKL
ncbi:hypothetical protein K431DRAFT_288662 [Polychaeton citri CBS 116435]|uniref:Transcription initiation factor TFIID subunit 4 n=1 Tax=Polychaeton citri CBS 116435 TaxID=1314669 RepID=A0A9P4UIV7_9PEZI|nr:hypothetical protein K431DRAFT_288662 [Polychaeton citri CBS 116435]